MALALDGHCSGNANGSAATVSNLNALVITAADIVVLFILMESTSGGSFPTGTSISDGFNTYALRNRVQYTSNAAFGSAKTTAEIWWAFSSAAHTIAVGSLVVTMANMNDCASFIAVSVKGFTGTAYQTNPWDDTAAHALAFAVTNTGATQTQLVSAANISTVNAATMIIAGGGSSDNSATVGFHSSYAVGTIGGTAATDSGEGNASGSSANASYASLETRVVAATQTNIVANFAAAATAGGWALMPDVLSQTGFASGDVLQSQIVM
jgi:hypothetical protein